MHFGEKVAAWLHRNDAEGAQPSTHEGLATRIHEPQPKVSRAIKTGQPKLHVAHKIARVMGMSLDYLSDADLAYPPREDDAWDLFVAGLTPDERARLAEQLRQPGVRALLLASRGAPATSRGAMRP